jgi:hypothetical protein
VVQQHIFEVWFKRIHLARDAHLADDACAGVLPPLLLSSLLPFPCCCCCCSANGGGAAVAAAALQMAAAQREHPEATVFVHGW